MKFFGEMIVENLNWKNSCPASGEQNCASGFYLKLVMF